MTWIVRLSVADGRWKQSSGPTGKLQRARSSWASNVMQWLGFDVDWKEALLAAKDLYSAVRAANDFLPREGRVMTANNKMVPDNNSMQRTALTSAAELRR